MELTLYTARCKGNQSNCEYPDKRIIATAAEMADAVKYDHVCAEYRNN